jgi:hypothetical protein
MKRYEEVKITEDNNTSAKSKLQPNPNWLKDAQKVMTSSETQGSRALVGKLYKLYEKYASKYDLLHFDFNVEKVSTHFDVYQCL